MVGHNHSVSLRGAKNLIKALGHKRTFLFEGETGIGKSYIMYSLMEELGDEYNYYIIDCTTLDVGDIQMPRVIEMNGMQLLLLCFLVKFTSFFDHIHHIASYTII